jgi:glycyl-tRNA synthetase beta chain
MKPFLLEIGVEELPVSFLHSALDAMPALAKGLFDRARIAATVGETKYGTARRLVLFAELAERQSDLSEEVLGPPKAIAFAPDGSLTKAALGFAKKQAIDASALRLIETEKGGFVGFSRSEKGRATAEILPAIVADLCKQIPFPKAMRWGSVDQAFGRPVHWLVVLFGGEAIEAEFAGARSGRASRGHRFLSPGAVEIASPAKYAETLERARVVVSIDERKARVSRALAASAEAIGGRVVADEFLLDENTSLVEEPFVQTGGFDQAFLALPEAVIVCVLRNHQRYFAVADRESGRLRPAYLNVANSLEDPTTVRRGNDRVLRARLKDAQFFVDEDRKVKLADRVAGLDRVVFQNKLGSIGDKVRRLEKLAPFFDADPRVGRACQLAKTDLLTLIVGEFPELQGEMGRYYALEQNEPAEVADAVADHYLPRGASTALPRHSLGRALALADRLDTLVGCFGIGLQPSGSADPFALRRAMIGVIRLARESTRDFELRAAFEAAYDAYPGGLLADRAEVLAKLDEFARARLRAYYDDDARDASVINACLGAWSLGSIADLELRLAALSQLRGRPEYEPLAIAFKRAHNIAKDVTPSPIDASLLEPGPESELAGRFAQVRGPIEEAIAARRYADALSYVANDLKAPIDRYFDKVLVMHADERIRRNRLSLLAAIASTVTRIVHFHEIAPATER